MTSENISELNPFFLALSRLRRRHYQDCIDISSNILRENPYDQAVWVTKCRALTEQNYIDDSEIEEDGVADLLLDENSIASMPRPGTSLSRPMSQQNGGMNQSICPMTSSGRPLSGFSRPGTGSRVAGTVSVSNAFQGTRPGTSRPVTALGRQIRLGTASMQYNGGNKFINVDKIDLKKYAARPSIAKTLCDYLLYHEHNPKKALELAAEATTQADYKDWWWKARLAKCYYQLGLYRDAEKQFQSVLKEHPMIIVYLELCKVYIKLDQPNTALEHYIKASEKFPGDTHILSGIARIYNMLSDITESIQSYKKVLHYDASSVEAIASLASNLFYSDQPEMALRYYRRLLQMGVNNAEIWTNLGLCCFYSSQYDMTLSCFERALHLASDDNMADVWYNIGQIGIGIGDLNLAYQAFKIALSIDPNHAESYNNLGVLELRKGNISHARSNLESSSKIGTYLFEPCYNGALLAYKLGDFQQAYSLVGKALAVYPEHWDSLELKKQLQQNFMVL